jgi:DNA-binding GntR family transcriptional regulator
VAAAPGDVGEPPADGGSGWLRTVADDVTLFDRSSTAERVADVLRRRITEGDLPPRTRLSEEQLGEVLRVSRNTLREAFRLLTLYRLRRTIECHVVRSLDTVDPSLLRLLDDDVQAGESAARRGDWVAAGTANMRFHRHLVALAVSPRINEVTERLLAELRLAFHAVSSPRRLYEPYVARNRALLDLLAAGEFEHAARELDVYLADSLSELLETRPDVVSP